MLTINDFNEGEKTRGTVVKVNRDKIKVRQDETRGTRRTYPVGTTTKTPKRTRKARQTPARFSQPRASSVATAWSSTSASAMASSPAPSSGSTPSGPPSWT